MDNCIIPAHLAAIEESPLNRYDCVTYCHNCHKTYNIRSARGNSIEQSCIFKLKNKIIRKSISKINK